MDCDKYITDFVRLTILYEVEKFEPFSFLAYTKVRLATKK